MRTFRSLRAIALALTEWWRKQHDVPRAHDQGVGEVRRLFDPHEAANAMRMRQAQGFDTGRRRLLGKPV